MTGADVLDSRGCDAVDIISSYLEGLAQRPQAHQISAPTPGDSPPCT